MARLNYSVPTDALHIYKKTKLFAIVDEFIESGADIAEFLFADGEYATISTARNAVDQSIKSRHINTVKVVQRRGHIYLVRKEIDNA